MRSSGALGSVALVGVALLAFFRPVTSEPPAKVEDAWVGSYLKYESGVASGAGEPTKLDLTRQRGVYKLSKPYALSEFEEVEKGVLKDRKNNLGRLVLGTMQFGDGRRVRVLRADFCYETFYMIEPSDAKGPAKPEPAAKRPKPSTIAEAEKLVRDLIFREKPSMNPDAQFPLKDITTKAVWDRLGAQVFRVTEGVQVCETFVIRAGKVHRIGTGFGGSGVTSLAVADLNGDGRDKLIYAYSWGSGRHRSHVAVFDCLAKVPGHAGVPGAYFGDLGDLAVKNGEGDTIEVYAGRRMVGLLVLTGKEGALEATLRLRKDLPAEVKAGFKGDK